MMQGRDEKVAKSALFVVPRKRLIEALALLPDKPCPEGLRWCGGGLRIPHGQCIAHMGPERCLGVLDSLG